MPNRRLDADSLVVRLGSWAPGPGTLAAQLTRRLEQLIDDGTIPARSVLPPERSLATALPASRGVVVTAYNELAAAGRVARHQGSGTLVLGTAGPETRRSEAAAALRAAALTDRMVHPGVTTIDLAMSVLDDALALDSLTIDPSVLQIAGAGHGYLSLGTDALRMRVAEIVTASGFPTSVDEVMITNGAQHAVALAATVLVRGGTVAIEDPAFPPAIDLYSRLGASFAPVSVDEAGIIPSSLASVLGAAPAAVVHLAPTISSPMGIATTLARQEAIADLLTAHPDAWLIEDDALRPLSLCDPLPPLAASRPDRAILAGSCSKLFWGGLRVGWLRAPAAVVDQLGGWRAATDLGTAIGPQLAALRLLDDHDATVRVRRATVGERLDVLLAELDARLPAAEVTRPDGGLSVWVRLPGVDARALCRRAAAAGVSVLPGDACSVTGGGRDAFRMSLWATPAVLSDAVARLAVALGDS